MSELSVSIDSWIIQDGNYGDFTVGQLAKFALEFAGGSLQPSLSKEPQAHHIGYGVYDVCAQVIYVNEKVWVVDFGFMAYWESKPPEFAIPGTWVEGKILIGVDPFFYMEHLRKLPDMPNLFYSWQLTKIIRDDTPWLIERNIHGGQNMSRDKEKEVWTSVPCTDAWNDNEGRSSYVFNLKNHDV